MALNDTALNAMANQLASLATYASLHTADPGTNGANEAAVARVAVTWNAADSGDISLASSLSFTGGPASGAATYVGLWSASTGGTFYGGFALAGDQTMNAAGEYTITQLTVNGSAA